MDAKLSPEARPPRLLHLDGLRGLAVLFVIIHHFVTPLLGNEPASRGAYLAAALTLSYTGVDLFFVLSGYLIGGILLDHLQSPRLMSAFYLRRSARILPLGFLCMLLILLAHAIGLYPPQEGLAPWPLPVYFTFVANWWMANSQDWGFRPLSHLWSIGIEEQFYLLAPLLMRLLFAARTHLIVIGFIAIAPLSRFLIIANHPADHLAAGMLPFCRSDSLGLGILVAWILRNPRALTWWKNHLGTLLTVMGVAALGCAFLTKLRAENGGVAMAAGGYTIVAVFYAAILLFLELRRDSTPARLLRFAPLRLIGKYSYFLYLFQGLVIGLAVGLIFHRQFSIIPPTNWIQLGVGLSALVGLAALSWRFFEAPILAWGHRFSYRAEAP